MTATRDPDRLIQAFLEEGPAVMTDRVLDAIREDVDATNQRAGIAVGPWRNLPMIRPILATAAVVAAVAIGLAAYAAFGPYIGTEPSTPEPTPIPEAFPADGPLTVGTTYAVTSFPVTLTIPTSLSETDVFGQISDANNFKVDAWDYGIVTFHDDVQIVDDICNPTDTIPVPATPEEVGNWLAGATGATVSEPIELVVQGRPALAYDVALGADCVVDSEGPVSGNAFWFQAGEHHRVYAIPTGDDTILGVTWGTEFGGQGEEFLDTLHAATDDLVQSMTFD